LISRKLGRATVVEGQLLHIRVRREGPQIALLSIVFALWLMASHLLPVHGEHGGLSAGLGELVAGG